MSIFREFKGVNYLLNNFSMSIYESFLKTDVLKFNNNYQRNYVWSEKEQQFFLRYIFSGYPLNNISLMEINYFNENFFYEVIDGKQRLITLKLFFENKIPLINKDKKIYFNDLSKHEQFKFKEITIPTIVVSNIDEKSKIDFFHQINFNDI